MTTSSLVRLRTLPHYLSLLRRVLLRAFVSAVQHDFLNLAQSSAYSAMFSLFPTLIVCAAILAVVPNAAPLRDQVGAFFDNILPSDVLPVLTAYFASSHNHARTVQAINLAALFSLVGASGVMATLMEGLRRANDLPHNCWTFLQRRARAFLLVPLSLVPLAAASLLVVFGQWITFTIADQLFPEASPFFLFVSIALRWALALAGVVGCTSIIYHLGTPLKRSWYTTLPGACVATSMWFLTTLGFAWYVTRFANYTEIYGSLGAGIALLVWLSIIFLSVLSGAEFNHQFLLERKG